MCSGGQFQDLVLDNEIKVQAGSMAMSVALGCFYDKDKVIGN